MPFVNLAEEWGKSKLKVILQDVVLSGAFNISVFELCCSNHPMKANTVKKKTFYLSENLLHVMDT